MWKDITRRRREGIKELHEMFAILDACWECTYKGLYEVGDIV